MTTAQRFWKLLGQSRVYKNIGRIHTQIYRLSGGRIGHRAGSLRNLLLTTTGRRSGQKRTCPLAYLEDEGRWILIGSNGGNDNHPDWYLNLNDDPRATIQVGRRSVDVVATTASGEEQRRLWSASVRSNPQYAIYETITSREIPVVVLTPAD